MRRSCTATISDGEVHDTLPSIGSYKAATLAALNSSLLAKRHRGTSGRCCGSLGKSELDTVAGEVLVVERHLEAILSCDGCGRDATQHLSRRVVGRKRLGLAKAAAIHAHAGGGGAGHTHECAARNRPAAGAQRGHGSSAVYCKQVRVGGELLAVERDLQRHRAFDRCGALAREAVGAVQCGGGQDDAEAAARQRAGSKVAPRYCEQATALGRATQREDGGNLRHAEHEEVDDMRGEVLAVSAHIDRDNAMRTAAADPHTAWCGADHSGGVVRWGGRNDVCAKGAAIVHPVREEIARDGDRRVAGAGPRVGANAGGQGERFVAIEEARLRELLAIGAHLER
eukprot:scaffold26940_cov117-Phaeocystis_antarctica.AAC.20